MSQLTKVDCELAPFKIPHFTERGAIYTQFPLKYDFFIADIDSDGVITDQDQELWTDKERVVERINQLRYRFTPALPEDIPIWQVSWWKDSDVVVTATFDSQSVSLPWNDDWTLKFTLPKEYADLQMTLMFLAANQHRFLNEIEKVRKDVDDVLHTLQTTGVELLPEGQRMRDRLEHVYRTYRRL